MLWAASILSLAIGAPVSLADLKSYCEAFARDLANRKVLVTVSVEPAAADPNGNAIAVSSAGQIDGGSANRLWRQAYYGAFEDCMQQYTSEPTKPVVNLPKLVKPALVKPTKPTVAAKTKPAVVAKKEVDNPDTASTDAPKAGTPAWNKYCLAKHPSFSAETGSYRTWSGAQRKCR